MELSLLRLSPAEMEFLSNDQTAVRGEIRALVAFKRCGTAVSHL